MSVCYDGMCGGCTRCGYFEEPECGCGDIEGQTEHEIGCPLYANVEDDYEPPEVDDYPEG